MMKVALADTLLEWDTMIGGVDGDPELQAQYFQELRDELAAMREILKTLADEQLSLEARRREVTRQLRIKRGLGQDVAIKLKGAIKSHYGHRYAGLSRFRIRPVRQRSRRVSEDSVVPRQPRSESGPADALDPNNES